MVTSRSSKKTTRKPATKTRAKTRTKAKAPAQPKLTPIEKLSAAWNTAGRAYSTDLTTRLAKFYGGDTDVDLDGDDPRSEANGRAVLKEVVRLNRAGKWQQARDLFDPAYAPLFSEIKKSDTTLPFVTILGPDEFLVRRGAAWVEDSQMFHLKGGTAKVLRGVSAAARSSNRAILALAKPGVGIEMRNARAGLVSKVLHSLPWPSMALLKPPGLSAELEKRWAPDDSNDLAVEQLVVSNDGKRVAISCYRQGILLGSLRRGEPTWQLMFPSTKSPWNFGSDFAPEDADEKLSFADDMLHVALSGDGNRLAFGCQDSEHFLLDVTNGKKPTLYATVGQASEYPHDACFSADGNAVALNSCHFYSGATRAFVWPGKPGAKLAAYTNNKRAPVIDSSLRVYASAWLEPGVWVAINEARRAAGEKPKRKPEGVFALAGSGVLRGVAATGGVLFAQTFGSSASSMDFCPESRRLVVASYSGFVHVFDPYQNELSGRGQGYRTRRELKRWVMWDHLDGGPICW